MAQKSPLPCSISDGIIAPHFLDERDHPWLRTLLEEYARFSGRPRKELTQRFREPLPFLAPLGKKALILRVLERLSKDQTQSALPPRQIRSELFTQTAGPHKSRETILSEVSNRLKISVADLESGMFADLPQERRVSEFPNDLSVSELALRANLSLVQGLLARALLVKINLEGNSRGVVRHAKLKGLICLTERDRTSNHAKLIISGPYSLFRKTLIYGRALGELVPILSWTNRFQLRAQCFIRGKYQELYLKTGDPIFPSRMPRAYDSKLEEAFAKSFRRLSTDWDLIREPQPIEAADSVIFPDFSIQHRRTPSRKWMFEIVGFWTRDYLMTKLEHLRKAQIGNLILCIRENYQCSEADLPQCAKIIRFRKKVDARAVLGFIEDQK